MGERLEEKSPESGGSDEPRRWRPACRLRRAGCPCSGTPASLASPHSMPVAGPPVVTIKLVSRHCHMSPEGPNCPTGATGGGRNRWVGGHGKAKRLEFQCKQWESWGAGGREWGDRSLCAQVRLQTWRVWEALLSQGMKMSERSPGWP